MSDAEDFDPPKCPKLGGVSCAMRRAEREVRLGRGKSTKSSATDCELKVLRSLQTGDEIEVSNHDTGDYWRGTVDLTFSESGFVWIFTHLGERKLVDMSIHTVWLKDTVWGC